MNFYLYDSKKKHVFRLCLGSLRLMAILKLYSKIQPGDMGLAAVPGRENDFRAGLEEAIKYAKGISCSVGLDFISVLTYLISL